MTGVIQTYTGRMFPVFAPTVGDFDIEDVARSLSRQCRFNGHCKKFYSVAEHSVLMSQVLRGRGFGAAFAALMHDMSEAYLTDLPSPVKRRMKDFVAAEKRIMRVGAKAFGFEYPLPRVVHAADKAILRDEYTQNITPSFEWPFPRGVEGLGVKLKFWSPDVACREFLRAYTQLEP